MTVNDEWQWIAVHSKLRIHVISLQDVTHVVAYGHQMEIHSGGSAYTLRTSLAAFMQQRGATWGFIRVSKSTAVNVAHVKTVVQRGYHERVIELHTGQRIPLTRRYWPEFKRKLAISEQ